MARIDYVKNYILSYLSYLVDYPLIPPKEVNFQMTNRCPLRCKMCKIPLLEQEGEELRVEEIKEFLNQVKDMGVKYVSFVGGEALVRKNDTIELIKYANSLGMYTMIVSNAYFLDKKTCKLLLDAGLKRLALSLDGAKEKTHDFIRGKGNYKQVMKAMKTMLMLRKSKGQIKLDFNTVILNINFRELVDIYYLTKRMGVDQVFYQALVADNTFQKPDSNDELWIKGKELKELEKIIAKLIEFKKRDDTISNTIEYLSNIPKYFALRENFRPGICLAGYMNINIDPYGRINVCGVYRPIDVRGKDLRLMWKSKSCKLLRKAIKKCRMPCMMLCYPKFGIMEMIKFLFK